jgi:hypothetical protein
MSKPQHVNPYLVDHYYKGDMNAYRLAEKTQQSDDNKAIIICLLLFVGLPLFGIWVNHRYTEYKQEQFYQQVDERINREYPSQTVPLR